MVISYINLVGLAILIFAVTQGYCRYALSSGDKEAALVAAIEGVSQALVHVGHTIEEGLHNISNEIHNSQGNNYTKEIEQIAYKITELYAKYGANNTESDNREEVASQREEQWTRKCEQIPNLDEIKQEMKQYIYNEDWDALIRHLKEVVDPHSVAHEQLKAEALWHIGYHDYIELATLLLCAGLPVDTADSDGDTLLHSSARGGHLQLVKLLVDNGASVNAKGKNGNTPLIWAADSDHLDTVKLLIEAGADPSIKNEWGSTARNYADQHGYTEMIKYFEQLSN